MVEKRLRTWYARSSGDRVNAMVRADSAESAAYEYARLSYVFVVDGKVEVWQEGQEPKTIYLKERV